MNNEIQLYEAVRVEKELPDFEDIYLVLLNGDVEERSWLDANGNWNQSDVTHWLRPLPNYVAISVERLEALISLAEDGYKLHVNNACHSEFLQEDREDISAAKQLLKSITK